MLAVLVLLCYAGTLRAGFVYDDHLMIEENVSIRSIRNVPLFFTDPAHTSGAKIFEQIYRPLRTTAYALQYRAWGLNPVGYHAVNVIIHLFNAFLVFLFLSHIVSARATAFVCAALFAVHPAMTETVAWVSCLSELLCMLFYLGGLLCYLKWRRSARGKNRLLYVAALVMSALAMLSKEMGVTFLVAVVALDLWDEELRPQILKRWRWYLPFLAVTVAYLLIRMNIMSYFAQREPWTRDLSGIVALMVRSIAYYVRLFILPVRLSIFPRFETEGSLLEASTALSAGLVLCLIAAAALLWRRHGPFTLGIALFFVLVLPVLNIIPIQAAVAERFLYVPSFALFLAVASLLRSLEHFRERLPKNLDSVAWGGLSILVFLFSLNTISRVVDWRDDLALFSSAVRITPDDARARIAVGKEHFFREDYDSAEAECLAALRADPRNAEAHVLLGSIFLKRGLTGPAEREFKAALAVEPLNSGASNSLGLIYKERGKLNEALSAFQAALERSPTVSEYLNNVGSVLLMKGDAAAALDYFTRALESRPDNWEASRNLASALIALQRYEEAIGFIGQLLAERPSDARLLYFLGRAHEGRGNGEAAKEAYERASVADPADIWAPTALANLYAQRGEYEEAVLIYRRILARYPGAVHQRVALASAFEEMGKVNAAIEELRIAVRLNPQDDTARRELERILGRAGGTRDVR